MKCTLNDKCSNVHVYRYIKHQFCICDPTTILRFIFKLNLPLILLKLFFFLMRYEN